MISHQLEDREYRVFFFRVCLYLGLGCDQLGHSFAASSSESESSKFLSNAQIVDGLLPENGGGKSLSDSLFQPPTLVIFRRLFQTIDEDCHLFLNVS